MKRVTDYIKRVHARGFTIIEAFVGITILLIGIVGPLVLVNTNFQAGRFSRDQITAYYLAQEAIEVVREIRDENFLEGDSWLTGLNACTSSNGCRIDGRAQGASAILGCGVGCEQPLRLNRSTGEYSYRSGDEETRFYRYVRITDNNLSQATVTVYVGFDTGRYEQEYTTVDYLRNWSPR